MPIPPQEISTDYLIVGQGVAGTTVGYNLHRIGADFLVASEGFDHSSSYAAAGIINPVTGRKYTKSWKIDELLPEAIACYRGLEQLLGIKILRERPIYRSLFTIKEENDWSARLQDHGYLAYIDTAVPSVTSLQNMVRASNAYGPTKGSLQIDLPTLLDHFRQWLGHEGRLITDHLAIQDLDPKALRWGSIRVNKAIIFSEGYKVLTNPYFNYLPFDPAKGEALIVRINGGFECNLRDQIFITPIGDDLYWVGAAYEWDYADHLPTAKQKDQLTEKLRQILTVDFEVVGQRAGIRPCVKTRRPILGRHPVFDRLVLFNGLGTKGTSLAPYFAKELMQHLIDGGPLHPEVDINRYPFPTKDEK